MTDISLFLVVSSTSAKWCKQCLAEEYNHHRGWGHLWILIIAHQFHMSLDVSCLSQKFLQSNKVGVDCLFLRMGKRGRSNNRPCSNRSMIVIGLPGTFPSVLQRSGLFQGEKTRFSLSFRNRKRVLEGRGVYQTSTRWFDWDHGGSFAEGHLLLVYHFYIR